MAAAEHPLEHWLTGIPVGAPAGRTMVVENAGTETQLRGAGLIEDTSTVFVRVGADGAQRSDGADDAERPGRRDGAAGAAAVDVGTGVGGRHTYRGTFAPGGGDVLLDNGYRLHLRQYGGAEFLCLDTPTALRLTDGNDVSAYLRDADQAWLSGTFAHHVTHPNAILADLAGLGGPSELAGPEHRVFVSESAELSTSPTGAVLGRVGDSPAELDRRWRDANAASRYPDAACLVGVISDRDRADALAERPWIGRYLAVAAAIRAVRRDHREPSGASGFGSRIAPGLPVPSAADPVAAPVLLRLGDELVALDPAGGTAVPLTASAFGVLEAILALDSRVAVQEWAAGGVGLDAAQSEAELERVLGLLTAAGICRSWCGGVTATWGASDRPGVRS